ncbi:hypothetical protein N0V90_012540 [Kalmusia sp. IMI 367209]|nr:hypothetical protein N0V90_012540 [Kalmusia sp. IMI 367209]
MPNVLVIGGSGYLGLVWGTARSDVKASQLRANEITALEDVDLTNPHTLTKAILTHSIDAVIDASSAYEQVAGVLEAIKTAACTRATILTKDKAVGPKLAFIYTSGSWVHGSPSRRVNDLTPPGVVHVDDLAAAYVGALDRIDNQLGAWPVFDVGTENLWIADLLEAAKAALGVKAPLEYVGTHGNAFLEALSLVANIDFARARLVLGWQPRRVDFGPNIACDLT